MPRKPLPLFIAPITASVAKEPFNHPDWIFETEEMSLRSTILDGEIVALDEEGIPRFQLLQKWQKRPTAPVVYVLFDLLWDNGRDLTGKSVIQRRERLQEIITPVAGIQVGGYLERRGMELFQLAKDKRFGRNHRETKEQRLLAGKKVT
jgi:bifunctional non-homologous end joining protein LigD